ncbi:hypothetical protein MNEG_5314 [Monoraphidium neglectum]|uniref:Uncharacterized protein n=1 Tax=Monoraphidium neglectum TaxID=145388 RepID=A0A0D2MI20_9CHLO|nr:hypothetical protein MNEG_5314 [Monoraphidium neglectum]KIZ02645.1 hypothetical protein MNEG_5314 [Monoraphidium neglectum]|eukprot:XP_013901664.1 hypothetical protein MNEG_5314 [Monoraphidium neglectum]
MIKACQEQWRRRRRRQQPSPASALLSTRPAAALQVPPLLPLLLLLLAPCQRALAQEALCQPGLIKLEEPRGPPARVQLPFCKEFGCSCCASRHALSIARAFSRTTDGGDTSDACVAALRLLACRPCDPEVGVGSKPAVCLQTCDATFDACREDFFTFSESSGSLAPCGSETAGALVCSTLSQHVSGGRGYCEAMGWAVAEEQPCYNGSVSSEAADQLCAASDAAAEGRKQRQQQRRQRGRRRGGGGSGGAWAGSALAWLASSPAEVQRAAAGGAMLLAAGALLLATALAGRLAAQQRRRAVFRRLRLGGGDTGGGGGGGGSGVVSAEDQRQAQLQAARMREATARAAVVRAAKAKAGKS